jgi:hypothetical protein
MHGPIRIARWALLATLLPLAPAGCGGGAEVTPESLARARRTWERAGVRDYDLEWTSTGLMSGHYRVAVRGGQVRTIQAVLPDGRTVEAHPGEPRYYGVEGLFVIIGDELEQLKKDAPFGQAKGTRVVLRFTADPKLGYPRRYRRDVVGTPQALAIDVIRFDPDPPPDHPARPS